jgi:hypothetical protein
MLDRAMQIHLYGRKSQEEAGSDWAKANAGLRYLRTAFWIADGHKRLVGVLDGRPLGYADGFSEQSRFVPEDVWLTTLQGWKAARLVQGGFWQSVMGLGTFPYPRDPSWSFDPVDADAKSIAPQRQSPRDCWNNLWADNAVFDLETWNNRWPGLACNSKISHETLAATFRTRALQLFSRSINQELWRRQDDGVERIDADMIDGKEDWRTPSVQFARQSAELYLKASEEDVERKVESRLLTAQAARSYVEAALLAGPGDGRENLRELARECVARVGGASRLQEYFEPLDLFMDGKLWSSTTETLAGLQARLRLSGHWHLATIMEEVNNKLYPPRASRAASATGH